MTSQNRRSRTIFPAGDEVELSELTLPSDEYMAFSAGQRIALMHRAGLIHGDLHREQLFFDPATGLTSVIDYATAYRSDIDPDRMFQDIVMVRVTMGSSWARGFLTGYTKTSYLLTDPEYPGYTDALLARAGGNIHPCQASQPVFTEAQCAALFDPLLDLSDGFPRLIADVPDGTLTPEDATLVRCALLMAGVGNPALLRVDARAAGVARPLLEALAGQTRKEDTGTMLVPVPSMLQVFNKLAGDPQVLRALAGMTDLYDWLAVRLDQDRDRSENAIVNSVRTAQLSTMLLQHGSWPTWALEAAELTVTARHRYLSWFSSMLSAQPDEENYFHLIAYLISRLTLYEIMFADDRYSSRLWSANWRGLALSRTTLHNLLSAIRAETLPSVPENFLLEILKILLAKVGRAVRDTVYASMPVLGPKIMVKDASPWSEHFQPLVDESKWAIDTISLIQKRQPTLGRLVARAPIDALIKRFASLSSDDFDKNAVLGIDSDFWREDRNSMS